MPSTPANNAQRTLMSLYYSSPFADGGFLDQLQESVVDADERVPLTQPEGVLPAPTSTQTHGVSTAEVPLPQKQAPDKLGFPRAPANPRHFEVLSVVRNLSEDSSPPPPPPAVPFSNPPPPQHLSLSHADADDPILAALHSQSTQQSSSFYSQPIPLPLTSPPTPPLQSTHTTGRYADTTPSTSFSLPARIEPGLDEFKDKVGEGWNFVKGWVTEKGREVRETVNARQVRRPPTRIDWKRCD